jgi:hypothetical protein
MSTCDLVERERARQRGRRRRFRVCQVQADHFLPNPLLLAGIPNPNGDVTVPLGSADDPVDLVHFHTRVDQGAHALRLKMRPELAFDAGSAWRAKTKSRTHAAQMPWNNRSAAAQVNEQRPARLNRLRCLCAPNDRRDM